MKKYLILLLTLFALGSCEQDDTIIDATADKKLPKVDVCHYDAKTDTWKTLNINGNALKAHLRHGDFEGSCEETKTDVPDDNFEYFLYYKGYDELPLDGYVLTKNIAGIKELHLPYDDGGSCGGPCSDIADLTGIEDFISLEVFSFGLTLQEELNFSFAPNLKELRIIEPLSLNNLNLSNNLELTHLRIDGAKYITSLDLTKNTKLKLISFDDHGGANTNISSLDLSKNVALESLSMIFVPISILDLSKNVALTDILIDGADELIGLNVQNGNNTQINSFSAFGNNLNCVQVDNVIYSTDNWTLTGPTAYFSVDCGF